jgi:hypothetical protein
MKTYWAVEVQLHSSWSRHWTEESGQLHVLAALPHGERALCTHWIGDSVGPRASLDATGK